MLNEIYLLVHSTYIYIYVQTGTLISKTRDIHPHVKMS